MRALMTADPITIRADAPLSDAARLLDSEQIHGLPVVDAAGVVIGVVSQTDVVRARTTAGLWTKWPHLEVRHLMTTPAVIVSPDAGIAEAAMLMEGNHVHRLVVAGPDRRPLGIVSVGDLLRAIVSELA